MIEVDGGCEPVVDAHEVPEAMREIVHVRDGYEVFPYSSRASRSLDLDYTIPYLEGVPVQPRSSNLGPLTRRAHRGKTHGGWRSDLPRPGVFWWQSPRGQVHWSSTLIHVPFAPACADRTGAGAGAVVQGPEVCRIVTL
ncbi:MAG: hypothetical protein QM628_13510 [Propionicimonas sp.]